MQVDFFALPIERPPVGLTGAPETQVGPAGQVFRAWQRGGQSYLSVELGGVEVWYELVATKGRRRPGWN